MEWKGKEKNHQQQFSTKSFKVLKIVKDVKLSSDLLKT